MGSHGGKYGCDGKASTLSQNVVAQSIPLYKDIYVKRLSEGLLNGVETIETMKGLILGRPNFTSKAKLKKANFIEKIDFKYRSLNISQIKTLISQKTNKYNIKLVNTGLNEWVYIPSYTENQCVASLLDDEADNCTRFSDSDIYNELCKQNIVNRANGKYYINAKKDDPFNISKFVTVKKTNSDGYTRKATYKVIFDKIHNTNINDYLITSINDVRYLIYKYLDEHYNKTNDKITSLTLVPFDSINTKHKITYQTYKIGDDKYYVPLKEYTYSKYKKEIVSYGKKVLVDENETFLSPIIEYDEDSNKIKLTLKNIDDDSNKNIHIDVSFFNTKDRFVAYNKNKIIILNEDDILKTNEYKDVYCYMLYSNGEKYVYNSKFQNALKRRLGLIKYTELVKSENNLKTAFLTYSSSYNNNKLSELMEMIYGNYNDGRSVVLKTKNFEIKYNWKTNKPSNIFNSKPIKEIKKNEPNVYFSDLKTECGSDGVMADSVEQPFFIIPLDYLNNIPIKKFYDIIGEITSQISYYEKLEKQMWYQTSFAMAVFKMVGLAMALFSGNPYIIAFAFTMTIFGNEIIQGISNLTGLDPQVVGIIIAVAAIAFGGYELYQGTSYGVTIGEASSASLGASTTASTTISSFAGVTVTATPMTTAMYVSTSVNTVMFGVANTYAMYENYETQQKVEEYYNDFESSKSEYEEEKNKFEKEFGDINKHTLNVKIMAEKFHNKFRYNLLDELDFALNGIYIDNSFEMLDIQTSSILPNDNLPNEMA